MYIAKPYHTPLKVLKRFSFPKWPSWAYEYAIYVIEANQYHHLLLVPCLYQGKSIYMFDGQSIESIESLHFTQQLPNFLFIL